MLTPQQWPTARRSGRFAVRGQEGVAAQAAGPASCRRAGRWALARRHGVPDERVFRIEFDFPALRRGDRRHRLKELARRPFVQVEIEDAPRPGAALVGRGRLDSAMVLETEEMAFRRKGHAPERGAGAADGREDGRRLPAQVPELTS